MSDIVEAQRSLERHASRATYIPQSSLASVRDPAVTLSETCRGILDIIDTSESVALATKKQKQGRNSVVQCAGYFQIKSICDRAVTAVLMVVALPLMAIVSVAILVLDGRPIFYRQTRVGRHGKNFQIWKFRTMCQNAECGTGAVWSSEADPRVTALGRWLRCSHLDELPQFLNILAGDMNLIGPRPERPEFVERLEKEIPLYSERLNVRPGLTGLAQLRLGYDQSIAGVHDKVIADLEYIQSTNIILDAKILVATLPYIAKNLLQKQQEKRVAKSNPEKTASRQQENVATGIPEDLRRRLDSNEKSSGLTKKNSLQAPAA